MLRIREAVRAVLITPADDVLLVRFEFPRGTVWAFPGGGIEPDEDDHAALQRELGEEVGLAGAEVGPHVWSREHIIPHEDGRWDGQRDRFYLVPVPARFEPTPTLSWDQLRAERLHEIRWWSLADIETDRRTWFAPRRVGELLRSLVDVGPPRSPVDTGV